MDKAKGIAGPTTGKAIWAAGEMRALLALVGCVAAVTAGGDHSSAQSVGFNPNINRGEFFARRFEVSVLERPQPGYDQEPIRLGAFDLLATLGGRVEAEDNIFATRNNRVSDTILSVRAVADLRSDWVRHGLRAYARAEPVPYLNNPDQDADQFGVGAAGVLDLARGAALQAGAEVTRDILPRSSSRSVGTRLAQVVDNEVKAFVGGTYGLGATHFSLSGEYRANRFDGGTSAQPDAFEDFGDVDRITLRGRGAVALNPSMSVFAQAA